MRNETAVLILNYANAPLAESCARKLRAAGYDGPIVVADNASPDGSLEALEKAFADDELALVVGNAKNGGYAYGNNRAAEAAIREFNPCFLCVMNPDVTVPSGEVIDVLCDDLTRDPEAASAAPLQFMNGKFHAGLLPWDLPKGREIWTKSSILTREKAERKPFHVVRGPVVETETLPGSLFVIRAGLWREMGGLSEATFMYGEENLLGAEIKERGRHCLLNLSVRYDHWHPARTKAEVEERYRTSFGAIMKDRKANRDSRIAYAEKRAGGKGRIGIWVTWLMDCVLLRAKRLACLAKGRKTRADGGKSA